MSKVQLAGNASGTGIFTIASPNSNVDRTLTLPDNTGTLLSSASTLSPSQLGSQFSINASAPSNSFVMDASGRTTIPNQPAFYAYFSSQNTILSAGTLVFNLTGVNTGGFYSTSTGRFTAPVAGRYFFTINSQHYGGSADVGFFDLYVNGGYVRGFRLEGGDASTYATRHSSGVFPLNAGDFVNVYCNSNTAFWSDHSSFSGFLIG